MIISVPVHTAVYPARALGTFAPVDVASHAFVDGLYRPPVVLKFPPQTIISVPVHTAVCPSRAVGTSAPVEVVVHAFVDGLSRPPVFVSPVAVLPPHTTI